MVSTLDVTIFLEELMTAGKELADTEAEVKRLQILREKLQGGEKCKIHASLCDGEEWISLWQR